MKESELRIGNLVKVMHETVSVQEICKNSTLPDVVGIVHYMQNSSRCWSSAMIVEPITLTEEWLARLGFEKDGDYFSKNSIHYDLIRNLFYSGNDHVSGGNPECKINYVHQLQNLYFALTAVELIYDNSGL
jgi:hypothetical protein